MRRTHAVAPARKARRNRHGRRPRPADRPILAAILTAAALLANVFCEGQRRGASVSSPRPSLRVHLGGIERDLRSMCDGPLSTRGDRGRALDSICTRFARQCTPEEVGHEVAARALTSFIFDTLGIRFDTARSSIDNILPSSVARERQGSCLGISALMLVLAEECGIPLHGVLVPGHFFVRFDNGTERMNVETMKAGRSMPDAWYAERFGVPDPPGRYLENLTKEQTAAVALYNIGNAFLDRKEFSASIGYYRNALSALPEFVDAKGNYALALAGQGNLDAAIAVLSELKNTYPGFKAIDRTLGTLWFRKGDYETAVRYFEFALEREPRDAASFFNAGTACFHLRRFKDAERFFRQTIALQPDYPEARKALDHTVAAMNGKPR